jgi:hypothetical protein
VSTEQRFNACIIDEREMLAPFPHSVFQNPSTVDGNCVFTGQLSVLDDLECLEETDREIHPTVKGLAVRTSRGHVTCHFADGESVDAKKEEETDEPLGKQCERWRSPDSKHGLDVSLARTYFNLSIYIG